VFGQLDPIEIVLTAAGTMMLLVLSAAIGIVAPAVFVVGGNRLASISPSVRLILIMTLMVAGTVIPQILSGRILASDSELILNPYSQIDDESSGLGIVASQLFTGILLLLSTIEITAWSARRNIFRETINPLWLSMILFFFASVIVSGYFGTYRAPRLNDGYVAFVMTAVCIVARNVEVNFWRYVRWITLTPSLMSLMAMIMAPRFAWLPDFKQSIVPFLHGRLYGVADHPNSLGIIAAFAIVIECSPKIRPFPSFAILLVHLAVLFLAQSKTAWIAVLIAVVAIRWIDWKGKIGMQRRWETAVFQYITIISLLIVAAIGLAMLSTSSQFLTRLDNAGITTFTGRTLIWKITLDEFFRHPLTGYGPSLWDFQYRAQQGMLYVGQAHNQFIQTLGQAGLIGALSLAIYLFAMFAVAIKGIRRDGGMALILLSLLITRCFSESPLHMNRITGWDAWLHVAVFAAVVSLAAQNSRPNRASEGSES
jgi:O-antigen ligase